MRNGHVWPLRHPSQPGHPVLAFFSTFEDLDLPGSGPMESKCIRKFYDPSPTPILYVGPISNVLGRVPLLSLFLHGNSTPTIPHQLSESITSSAEKIRCFRRVLQEWKKCLRAEPVEVGVWAGRVLGVLSVTDTLERRSAVRKEGCKRAKSIRAKRSLKAPKAAAAQ